MERKIQIQSTKSTFKGGLKPDFTLFEERVGVPIFVPVEPNGSIFDIKQTSLKDAAGNFLPVQNVNNVVQFKQKTAFSITVRVLNPEDQIDPNNVLDLKFRWYKNGSYLYEVNNANDFKGTNQLAFSEEQCVPEISGLYTLEAINVSGIATTVGLRVRVFDLANVPELYGNLLENSSGEAGLDVWEVENDVVVGEFRNDTIASSNHSSIILPRKLQYKQDSNLISTSEIETVQPTPSFAFDMSSHWINMKEFINKRGTNPQGAGPEGAFSTPSEAWLRWWYLYHPPNLIPNEDPGEDFGCFYPSKKFMDEYNGNVNRSNLQSEMEQAQTYFTRQPITRGGSTKASLTQTIDVSNIEGYIDGTVCGVNKVVGNFFAYVGLGIDSYTYRITHRGIYQQVPADQQKWDQMVNILNEVRSFIMRINTAEKLEIASGPMSQNEEFRLYIKRGGQTTSWDFTNARNMRTLQYGNHLTDPKEPFDVYTNSNGSGTRVFSMSFPEWKYAVLSDLMADSVKYSPFTNNAVNIDSYTVSGFAKLFGQLMMVKDLGTIEPTPFTYTGTYATYRTGSDLMPLLAHPDQNSNDQALRNAARAYLSGSLIERFETVQDYIMDYIIDPIATTALNGQIGTYLSAGYEAELLSNPDYLVVKAAIHAVCSAIDLSNTNKELEPNADISSPNHATIPALHFIKTQSFDPRVIEAREWVAANRNYNTANLEGQFNRFRDICVYWSYVHRWNITNPSAAIVDGDLITPAAGETVLNTLGLSPDNLKKVGSGQTFTKAYLKGVKNGLSYRPDRIELIPKCNNTVQFTFTYVDAFGDVLKTETLDGPTVDDIFSVKEKSFLAYDIGKLLQRIADFPDPDQFGNVHYAKVTYKNGPTLFEVSKNDINGGTAYEYVKDFYCQPQFKTLHETSGELYTDRGASAFFGIQKKLFIPRGTRSIQVKAEFLHDSVAIGLEPDTGVDTYDIEEIQAEHTTLPFKYFRSGNPKTGIAHMKLCLYDDEFKRTAKYPHFYMPRFHVWSLLKETLYSNPYKYMGSTGNQWVTTYPDIQTELPTGAGSPSYNLAMNFYTRYKPPTREAIEAVSQTYYQIPANAQNTSNQPDPGTTPGG
jgi:hypothetical protein